MIGGAIATMICLLAISWTREIVSGIGSIFGADPQSRGTAIAAQAWAILLVYVLDFAINISKWTKSSSRISILVGVADAFDSPSGVSRIHR